MDAETIQSLMSDQLDRVRESALWQVCGWEIEEDGLAIYVRMRPRTARDRLFLLCASFDDFPRRAPSCVFVEAQTRRPNDGAWPPNVRHGSAPPGICTPGTREFHEHYHVNDKQHPWDADRYPFLQTLMEIQRLMERGVQPKK